MNGINQGWILQIKKVGSLPLYSLLPIRVKMRLVVAGVGFIFYCTTQCIMLAMESKFVPIKRDF